MSLFEDIINELIDSDVELDALLLKAKVFASRIGNQRLLEWINYELNGYPPKVKLPEYRKTQGILNGSYQNGRAIVKNTQIPTPNIDKKLYDKFMWCFIRQSISGIKETIQESNKIISFSVPHDFIQYLSHLVNDPFYGVISAHKDIPSSFYSEIITSIRDRLLTFMLEIESQFGEDVDIKTLKREQQKVEVILNQTITNNGDNNVINTGNDNTISLNVTIEKGDKDRLAEALQKHQVPQEDITELLSFVDKESIDSSGKFSEKTNTWVKKMMNKAVDGTWSIGLSTAGGVLTQALTSFFGG